MGDRGDDGAEEGLHHVRGVRWYNEPARRLAQKGTTSELQQPQGHRSLRTALPTPPAGRVARIWRATRGGGGGDRSGGSWQQAASPAAVTAPRFGAARTESEAAPLPSSRSPSSLSSRLLAPLVLLGWLAAAPSPSGVEGGGQSHSIWRNMSVRHSASSSRPAAPGPGDAAEASLSCRQTAPSACIVAPPPPPPLSGPLRVARAWRAAAKLACRAERREEERGGKTGRSESGTGKRRAELGTRVQSDRSEGLQCMPALAPGASKGSNPPPPPPPATRTPRPPHPAHPMPGLLFAPRTLTNAAKPLSGVRPPSSPAPPALGVAGPRVGPLRTSSRDRHTPQTCRVAQAATVSQGKFWGVCRGAG